MARDKVEVDVITNTRGATRSIGKYALGVGGAVLAVKVLIKIGKDLSEAYFTQEKAETKLASAIKATGRSYEISTRSMKEYAAQLQQVTIFGDEATLSAMAMLQQLGNLSENELKDVTKATQDFASAMNVDLETAASLIGKTLGSSTNALSRYGIEIDTSLDKNEKLAALMGEIEEKFGGAAVAMGETAFGSAEKLNNAWGDLMESGGEMLNVVLTPMRNVLTSLVTKFNAFFNSVDSAETIIKRFNEAAGTDKGWAVDLLALVSPLEAAIRDTTADLALATKTLDFYQQGLQTGTQTAIRFGDSILIGAVGTDHLTDQVTALTAELAELEAMQQGKPGIAMQDLLEAYGKTTESAIETKEAQIAYFETFKQGPMAVAVLQMLRAELEALKPAVDEARESVSGLLLDSVFDFPLMLGGGFDIPLKMPPPAPQPGTTMPPLMEITPPLTGAEIFGTFPSLPGTYQAFMDQAPLSLDLITTMLIVIQEEEDIAAIKAKNMADAFAESLQAILPVTTLIAGSFSTMFKGMGESAIKGGDTMIDAMKNAFASILGGLAALVWGQAAVALGAVLLGDMTKLPALAQTAVAGGILSTAQGFVTAMRDGGTVTRPTLAMIGEAGPETVTRADRGGGGGTTVVNNFYGAVWKERDAARQVWKSLARDGRGY